MFITIILQYKMNGRSYTITLQCKNEKRVRTAQVKPEEEIKIKF